MVNYSIAMRGNPVKKDQPKKAYGVAQYADVFCKSLQNTSQAMGVCTVGRTSLPC